jgi:hypothetical protein
MSEYRGARTKRNRVALAALGPLILVACGQGKIETEARIAIPGSSAVIVIEREGYGGGAGSYYKDVFVEKGSDKERIVSARTLHPVRIALDGNPKSIRIEICRGRIFSAADSTAMPYGSASPVPIKANIVLSC